MGQSCVLASLTFDLNRLAAKIAWVIWRWARSVLSNVLGCGLRCDELAPVEEGQRWKVFHSNSLKEQILHLAEIMRGIAPMLGKISSRAGTYRHKLEPESILGWEETSG